MISQVEEGRERGSEKLKFSKQKNTNERFGSSKARALGQRHPMQPSTNFFGHSQALINLSLSNRVYTSAYPERWGQQSSCFPSWYGHSSSQPLSRKRGQPPVRITESFSDISFPYLLSWPIYACAIFAFIAFGRKNGKGSYKFVSNLATSNFLAIYSWDRRTSKG